MPSFCVKWLADWLAETKEKKRKGKRERERERKRRGKRFSRSNHSPANVFFYFQVQCHRVFSGFLCFFLFLSFRLSPLFMILRSQGQTAPPLPSYLQRFSNDTRVVFFLVHRRQWVNSLKMKEPSRTSHWLIVFKENRCGGHLNQRDVQTDYFQTEIFLVSHDSIKLSLVKAPRNHRQLMKNC